MIWPWFATIASVLLIVATVPLGQYTKVADWVLFTLAGVGALGLLIFGIMALSISVGRHYNRAECHRFAQTTNRTTRFVIYTTFSWDCLTPDGHGRWIPTKNLREFGND